MTEEREEKAGDCLFDVRKRCAWITPRSVPELSWKYILFKSQPFRRGHSAEEAAKETDAEQAVSKVEAAMTAAEKAAKETDAAEAARAYAEEASKTLKGKRTSAKW
ncbi:hypothetical protein Rs2_18985 [Raphanus sativus]|nr:hypothetical protein Rs2_18985 [Raphanus sativus]